MQPRVERSRNGGYYMPAQEYRIVFKNPSTPRRLSLVVLPLCLSASLSHPSALAQSPPREAAPGVWQIRFGEPEAITPIAVRTQPPATTALPNMPAAAMPLSASAISFRTDPRGCVVELPLDNAEQIFGLGLHPTTFNLTGTLQSMVVSDEQQFEDGSSHAPVPFYVSTRGYAVLVGTARYARFYSGNLVKAPPVAAVQAATNPASMPHDAAKTMTVEIPTARGVDVYIFAGPQMKDAVCRYNLFSGGGCLPPLWGLGVLYRGYGKYDSANVLKLAGYFREHHIPCDVFGLEPGWQSHTYSCSYIWSPERWPKPDDFLRKMADMGFQLNLWEHAFVHPTAPFYREIRPFCGDYEVWGGLVPDFLDPQARRIFADYHAREFVSKGITGFKLDECDHQPHSKEPWSFPEFSRFPSGVDGEQMHSFFGIVYQQTLAGIYAKGNLRTYGQVRASGALAAPLPFVLYSDYYDHRGFVRAILNSGFSGLLWQPELREAESLDDLYRRTQTTVLSAQVIVNAWEVPNAPWQQINMAKNQQNELMPNRAEAEAVIRDLFNLRMQLVPYLYASFARYHAEGLPPFRALVVDYPADAKTYKLDDQYMMGDSIMVAPLFGHDKERTVYFPAGSWYCFWTHKKYDGPGEQKIQMPPEKPPIFVKAGSILPLAEPVEHITPDTVFRTKLLTFGPDCRSLVLWEDDGRTLDFQAGRRNPVTITWSKAKGERIDMSDSKTGYNHRRYEFAGWEHY